MHTENHCRIRKQAGLVLYFPEGYDNYNATNDVFNDRTDTNTGTSSLVASNLKNFINDSFPSLILFFVCLPVLVVENDRKKRGIKFMRKEHVLELNFLMCNNKNRTKNLESSKKHRELNDREMCVQVYLSIQIPHPSTS